MSEKTYYIMCLEDNGEPRMIVSTKSTRDFIQECLEDEKKTGRVWRFIAQTDTHQRGREYQEVWNSSAQFHWEMGYLHGQSRTGADRLYNGYGVCTSLNMPISKVWTGHNMLKAVQDRTGVDIYGKPIEGRRVNKDGRFTPGQ